VAHGAPSKNGSPVRAELPGGPPGIDVLVRSPISMTLVGSLTAVGWPALGK
jgi:hypothetical protein